MRRILAAVAVLATLAACTTSGSGDTATTTASSGPTSSPSASPTDTPSTTSTPTSAPSSATARITSFHAAWTWRPVGKVADSEKRDIRSFTADDTRVITAAVVSPSAGQRPTTDSAVLSAADLRTGRTAWSRTIAHRSPLDVVIVAGTGVLVNFVRDNRYEMVGFDPASGRQRWRLGDLLDDPGKRSFAVIGRSVYAVFASGHDAQLRRIDAASGKITAQLTGYRGSRVFAAGNHVVVPGDSAAYGYTTDLRAAWHTAVPGDLPTPLIAGDTYVSVPDNVTKSFTVRGYDTATGRLRWARPVRLDDDVYTASAAGDLVVLATSSSATAIDAGTGAIAWRAREQAAEHFTVTTGSTGNLLGCRGALVSVDAGSGGLYGLADLPADEFGDFGCDAAPLQTSADSSLPGATVVTGGGLVAAYRVATEDDPKTGPDGYGEWGAPQSVKCAADGDATATALRAQFGRAWQLKFVEQDGTCFWYAGSGSVPRMQTGVLDASQHTAALLNPQNKHGLCATLGTPGIQRRVSVRGLPAGSALCTVTKSRSTLIGVYDLAGGLTVDKGGHRVYAQASFANGSLARVKGPQRILAVLRALAR